MRTSEGRECACIRCLRGESAESNPVELIWWGLHEAVSREHRCEDLGELVGFAERYLEEKQPFRPQLAEDYRRFWEGRRPEIGQCPFILCTYLDERVAENFPAGPLVKRGNSPPTLLLAGKQFGLRLK